MVTGKSQPKVQVTQMLHKVLQEDGFDPLGGTVQSSKSSYSANQARLVRAGQSFDPLVTTTTITTVTTTTTTTQAAIIHTLTLPIGWNLLGNGWNQSLSVATLLGDKTKVTTVWKWDTTTSSWKFFTPSMTTQELQNYATSKGYGILSEISAGEGFWVNVAQVFNLILPDTTPLGGSEFMAGKPHALNSGWNLIAISNAITPKNFHSVS